MADIFKNIESMMRSARQDRFFSFASVLSAMSKVYGGAVKLRETLYKHEFLASRGLPCAVVSVGNLTVGGTGKTPMTIYMAKLVRRLGLRAVVISRGYKGGAEKTGGIVSDGRRIFMAPGTAGDEPLMMASELEGVPVIVGRNRYASGMLAVNEFNPDVLVLDDAFQHLKLHRDIDLILLDGRDPFGNGHLLPRGVLREPLSALLRGDALILTRSDFMVSDLPVKLGRIARERPVFESFHIPKRCRAITEKNAGAHVVGLPPSDDDFRLLKGNSVFVFSGIAGNSDFRKTVQDLGCHVSGFLDFPDHHPYSGMDFGTILRSARNANAEFLVTTEKDYFRIADRSKLPKNLMVIGIEVSFGKDETRFTEYIKDRLEALCGKKGS